MAQKKNTYASVADKLSKKMGDLEKDLKSSDKIARTTAERMLPRLQEKMDKLYTHQEESKQASFQKEQSKLMAKYGMGGPIDGDPLKPRPELTQSQVDSLSEKFAKKSHHYDMTKMSINPDQTLSPEKYFTLGDRARNTFRPRHDKVQPKGGQTMFADGGGVPEGGPTYENIKAHYPDWTEEEIQRELATSTNRWNTLQDRNKLRGENAEFMPETQFNQSSSRASSPNNYDQTQSNLYQKFNDPTYTDPIAEGAPKQEGQFDGYSSFPGAGQGDPQQGGVKADGILGQAASYAPTIYNAIQGMQKPEQTAKGAYYNPNEEEAMNLMRDRRYNIDPQLDANNRGFAATRKSIGQAAGGDSSAYLATLGSAQTNKQRADAGAYSMKNNMDNQYIGQEAQALTNFGQGRARADQFTDDINARNRAARDNYMGAAVTGLSDISQYRTREKNRAGADNVRANTLQSYFGDYGYDLDENGRPTGNLNYKG